MSKEYAVQVDVTFSGDVYVTAQNKEEARTIAKSMTFVPSDLKSSFYFLSNEVVDIEEA